MENEVLNTEQKEVIQVRGIEEYRCEEQKETKEKI